MKILRIMAIVALVCFSHSIMALSNAARAQRQDQIKQLQNKVTTNLKELQNVVFDLQAIVEKLPSNEKDLITTAVSALNDKIEEFKVAGGVIPANGKVAYRKRLGVTDRHLNPKTTAVVIIDVQDDFTHKNKYKDSSRKSTNGALAVNQSGDEYMNEVVAATKNLKKDGYMIIASQDFHPAGHISFASSHPGMSPFQAKEITIPTKDGGTKTVTQVLWPDHCVQGSHGADILIPAALINETVQKGANLDCDSYSAFADDGGQETNLNSILDANNIKTIIVYGIATDYCVKYSVLHGLARGKKVYVVEDLCRGVDPAGSKKALEDMRKQGAIIIDSEDL
jgi:nicotinamidase/pyrazinamidase